MTEEVPNIGIQNISVLTEIYEFSGFIVSDGIMFNNSMKSRIIIPNGIILIINNTIKIFALYLTNLNYKDLFKLTKSHILNNYAIKITLFIPENFNDKSFINEINDYFPNYSIDYRELSYNLALN
jgi:hypothetical protein